MRITKAGMCVRELFWWFKITVMIIVTVTFVLDQMRRRVSLRRMYGRAGRRRTDTSFRPHVDLGRDDGSVVRVKRLEVPAAEPRRRAPVGRFRQVGDGIRGRLGRRVALRLHRALLRESTANADGGEERYGWGLFNPRQHAPALRPPSVRSHHTHIWIEATMMTSTTTEVVVGGHATDVVQHAAPLTGESVVDVPDVQTSDPVVDVAHGVAERRGVIAGIPMHTDGARGGTEPTDDALQAVGLPSEELIFLGRVEHGR